MASGPLDLVRLAAEYLAKKEIENPRLEAEVLLAHALRVPRLQLYLQYDKPLESGEIDAYRELLRRRARREPVSYITGGKEFWSLSLRVDARVLVPRPETERIVEAVLERTSSEACRLLDLGIGSGAIALSLLRERPNWTAVGVDVSGEALEVAEENAEQLGLGSRIELRRGDLFGPVEGEVFDVIVSNPPYVPSGEIAGLAPEVSRYEPRLALDGGQDGLDAIRRIAGGAPRHLSEGALLTVEFGAGQEVAILRLLEAVGFAGSEVLDDYTGKPRVAVARR